MAFNDNHSDAINNALTDNPRIQNSPALATDVIKSPNPQVYGQVLTHAATMNGVQQAAEDHAAENPTQHHWWDGITHNAVRALESMAKPLEEVQRDYKFIHSLYTRHGIFAGTLGTLAVAGGAVLGTFAGGPAGTVLGADLAAMGLRKIAGNLGEYKDSVADSENENYKVSMGRDVANALGAHGQTDQGWGKFVSGAVDAGFDIGLDPLMKLGVLSKSVKGGEMLALETGKVASGKVVPWLWRSQGAQAFLERNSLRMFNAEQVEAVYQSGLRGTVSDKLFGAGRQYHRALDELTDMSAGDIIAKRPELQGLSSELGAAKTAEEVHHVFIRTWQETEIMEKYAIAGSPFLPSRSVARGVLSKASDKLRQPFASSLDDTVYDFRNAANFIVPRFAPDGLGGKQFIAPFIFKPLSKEAFASAMSKKIRTFSGYQPFTIDPVTLDLSTKAFDPRSASAAVGVYRTMRFSMGDRLARTIAGNYADAVAAKDLGEARKIYLSGIHEMFKAAGLPNDSHLARDLIDHIGMKGEGTVGSQTYGHGFKLGDEVSVVKGTSGSSAEGLWEHQTGQWAYPDFRQVKLAMRSMGNVGKVYGTVDESVAKGWTDSIFKPLALLTTGFGLRIAASEIIPTVIRFGGIATVEAKISGAAAKMGIKLIPGEMEDLKAQALLALSGSHIDYTMPTTVGNFIKGEAGKVEGKFVRKTMAKGLARIADPEDFDLAARIGLATNGHMASGATMSGHGTDQDFVEKQRQLQDLLGQRVKREMIISPDGNFSKWTVHNDHFDIQWLTATQKASQNIAAQSIAKDVLALSKVEAHEVFEPKPFSFSGMSKEEQTAYEASGHKDIPERFFKTPEYTAAETAETKRLTDEFLNSRLDASTTMPARIHSLSTYLGLSSHDMAILDKHGVVPLKKVLEELDNGGGDFLGGVITHGDPSALNAGDIGGETGFVAFEDAIYREAGEYEGMVERIGRSKVKYIRIDWYPSRANADEYVRKNMTEFDTYWADEVETRVAEDYVKEMSKHYDDIAEAEALASASGAPLTPDQLWAKVTKMEEARLRGVYYDPSTPTGMGKPLDPIDDLYAEERRTLSRYKTQDVAEFAMHRTDDLRNTLTGSDRTFHYDIAESIADGRKLKLDDLFKIDSASKPKSIIGPELEPYVGPNVMNRIIQNGFQKVIDPIVGNLSRQPLFFQHTKQAMTMYQPLVNAGKITEEQALRFAMTRASQAMLPQIHNVALRTQFSILARNFLPFYFAQEQATKRYIKLASENPEAFRAYQLIEHGLNDPGFIQKDDQGNKFVTLPFVGELGGGVMNAAASLGMPVVGNLPITVRGDTKSLATVLPEFNTPGTSPFVNIAANSLVSFFPQLARPVKSTIGSRGFGTSVIDSLIPNAPARAWFKALNANEQDSTFHSAMLSALASANYHNQLPSQDASPRERQEFIDRIKNNARSILVIKGLLGTLSPLSPQVTQDDPGLRDEFYKLVADKGDYPTALHEFLGKHGDNAVSYTVSRSEGTIKGANMPYTNQVVDWLQTNEGLMSSKQAVGAAFLMPQATDVAGDKQAIYDEVLKMHLREKRTPQTFMDSIYISAGNNAYFNNKELHDKAIASFGENKANVDAENANWSKWVVDFKLANPIWADDFQSSEKRGIANQALDDFATMFANGTVPKGEQTDLVRRLLENYAAHEQAKQVIRGFNTGRTLTEENDNWSAYLEKLSKDEPRLTTVINGVFRRLS